MIFERLKIGQKVWVMEEFPIQLTITMIDKVNKEVWCDDGWNHNSNEIYSSEARCKVVN